MLFRVLLTLVALVPSVGFDARAGAEVPAAATAVKAALFAAVADRNIDGVRAALAAGASVNARSDYRMTPLLTAATRGSGEIAALLLAGGADPMARSEFEYQPIDYAVERDNPGVVQALLSHFANSAGTPAKAAASKLALAAARGDLEAVNAQLDSGADADGIGDSGYSALALAARWGHLAVVDALLERGADANLATRSRYNSTPLMEASRDGHRAIAERLYAAGADVNAGDRYGDHSLNWAAYYGHAPFVAALLTRKPDLQRRGQTDDWPLEIAIRERHQVVAELLVAAGAVARPGKEVAPVSAADLRGAWEVQEIHWVGKEQTRSIVPAQPGQLILTGRHYSLVWTTTPTPRVPFKVLAQPGDDEIRAGFQSFAFNAGSYESSGDTLTTTAAVARVPGFEGGRQFFRWQLDGDRLTLTMFDETYPDGSKPAWFGKTEVKLVFKRVE